MLETSEDESGFEDDSTSPRKQSSEEEEVTVRPPMSPLEVNPDREQLPAIPLSGFTHSLVPDMVFGWRPKLVHGGPIPLIFNKCELPVSLNASTGEEFPVIFNGFRPRDSMVMHQAYTSKDTYPMPVIPAMDVYEFLHRRDHRLKDTRPFLGMNPDLPSEEISFDSTFESGNLDKVVKIGPSEYDLYMRADANTRGYHQWYYFSVTNGTVAEVRFNIVNFTKNESLYSQGMLPVVLSEKDARKGWRRGGFDVKYRPSKLNSLIEDRKNYFALTFSYKFEHLNDKVFFAYAVPYTFTRLCRVLAEINAESAKTMRRDTLCKSLSGVDVPLVTITNFETGEKKDHVVITARVHPGETHGSWMVEFLRDRLVFTIVPCLNPDGVIMGNYRTGFSGHDLNRQFVKPDFMLHPTVAAVKKVMKAIQKEVRIVAFLDLHAHSKKKSVFIYGPYYPLHSRKYYSMRILPRLICEQGPQFRYAACRFRNEASKQQAARLVIWKELRLANSYTVEGSFYGFLTEERKTMPFSEESVLEVGMGIGKGLYQYVALMDSEARLKEERRKARRIKHSKGHQPKDSPHIPAPMPQTDTIEDVVGRIKGVEEKQGEPIELGDSSESSNDENIAEDQLAPEDQVRLHEEIVSIMEEFTSLSRPRLRRPITKVTKLRPKQLMDRVTPECSEMQIEEKSFCRSSYFRSKRKTRTPLQVETKVSNSTFLPLPRMAEYRVSRSVSNCKKKRSDLLASSGSKNNLSKFALETRRLLTKVKPGDSFEERIIRFLRTKTPHADHRPSLSIEDDDTEPIAARSLLITSKSPLVRAPTAPKAKQSMLRASSVVSSLSKARLKRAIPREVSQAMY